jgi:branched-chain amino acid transport system ATP-binding protein
MPPYSIVELGIIQVLEGRRIFPQLTVEENLKVGAYVRQDRREVAKDMEAIIELFPQLGGKCKQKGGSLSGGEQQMVAVGRGLMARPKLLMLDEPSLGLAPLLVQEVFKATKRVNAEGVTILLVEQNVKHTLTIATRAYVLENGRITIEGMGADLLKNDHVKKAYLGI